MFYEENKINSLLNCSFCHEKFVDIVRCLPCGEAICEDCCMFKLNLNNSREFKCNACKSTHKMPEEGLPFYLRLMKLLEIKPDEVSRSPQVEQLKQLLISLQEEAHCFKSNLFSQDKTIKDYCSMLADEIEVNFESAIEHLNKLKENQIKQVAEYEKEQLDRLANNPEREKKTK